MRRRLTWGLALLRVTGCVALLVLLWNPVFTRLLPGTVPPLVLLDVSLSMAGHGGRWREALDSARTLAHGGVIWRFGARIAPFDTLPPSDGASLLGPAIAAAAARGGPVAVVTDGGVSDVATIAPDLLQHPRIVALPRPEFRDAFIATVEGPHRIGANDTLRLKVNYGVLGKREEGRLKGETGGKREEGRGNGKATLVVTSEGRRLVSRDISLPDSGIVSTDLTLPASLFPLPGSSGSLVLEVRLQTDGDAEPRDDARLFVVEVNPTPWVVVLASPPDWDLRFFARTLAEVARVPVTVFVAPEPGGRWRDAATLAPVLPAEVQRALVGARLVVEGGDPRGFGRVSAPGNRARLRWPTVGSMAGEWYVDAPAPSPLAAGLGGLLWDSLPPAVGLMPASADSATVVALTARLARRGQARPIVLLSGQGGARRAEVAAVGLYRWAFRGGASGEAYRALVAELANWLLGEGGRGKGERAMLVENAIANGLPVMWRWTGSGTPHDLVATLSTKDAERRDTLRFDAAGEAMLLLPPAVYRYALEGGPERGVVAVETYSDEWRPTAPVLRSQAGAPVGRRETVSMRDHWWLFVLAIGAFTAEWAWRRRLGLA